VRTNTEDAKTERWHSHLRHRRFCRGCMRGKLAAQSLCDMPETCLCRASTTGAIDGVITQNVSKDPGGGKFGHIGYIRLSARQPCISLNQSYATASPGDKKAPKDGRQF